MNHLNQRQIRFRAYINRCTNWLEYAVAAIMIPAVLISFYDIIVYVCSMVVNIFQGEQASADFDILFALSLQLVIAVEFIIMMVNKSPVSIIEVLTLAFAKKILVGKNDSMIELFFGVLAVLLLIGARIAYNYFEGNKKKPNVLRGGTLIKDANVSLGLNLPTETDSTLENLVSNTMKSMNLSPKKGAEISFSDVTLRIQSMKGTHIDRIEVLPNLHETH